MRPKEMFVTAAIVALLGSQAVASAATPPGGTLSPDPNGQGSIAWSGTVSPGDTTAGSTDDCFGDDKKPRDTTTSGCDLFNLDVTVPAGFYSGRIGGVEIDLTDFGQTDIDLGIYERNADGTRGALVGGSGATPGAPEMANISQQVGSLYVVAVPFLVLPATSYKGVATFVTKKADPTLDQLNSNTALRGPENYRASRDRYLSHSEPTIAMDPRDHDHLMAASKMYDSLPKYFFKVGTYESNDGGRTWTNHDQLPGYCTDEDGKPFPPACDANDDVNYRVTSDPTLAFDDEGNAYANVLDAPGGASGPPGWNMQFHIKKPGQPWSGPITIHDNRNVPAALRLFLDDKNWIAVDNSTDTSGGTNRPGDGKIGTIYNCWSLDFGPVGQQIVLMRSVDGGKTWGGFVPGDNLPYSISQRLVISGIGCHIAIGPKGEVYVTWYDNVLDMLMQAKSTNRGQLFTPARPIAQITGVNEPFEGQAFRNLSIPTTAVDRQGTVYAAVMSRAEGRGADIVLFKSTDGGQSYSGPVRVNQDNGGADQFQPWLAVTDSGQITISYFDRRNDANNYFIQTWLSRSNDGGKTFTDVPVGHRFWDPAVNPPISPSGQFIGDYQGLVADDDVAIPFWNDTQANTLPTTDPEHSPYQEVWAARILNTAQQGGPGGGGPGGGRGRSCLPSGLRVGARGLGPRLRIGATQRRLARDAGAPAQRRTRLAVRYCVRGGGSVRVAFSPRLRARLIATTAPGHRARGIHRGSRLRAVRRAFPGTRRIRRGVYLASRSRRLVVGVRGSRVRYLAVTDRGLVRRHGLLQVYLERAGLP